MKKNGQIKWERDSQIAGTKLNKRISMAVWDSIAILLCLFSAVSMYTKFGFELQLERNRQIEVGVVVFFTVFLWEVGLAYWLDKIGGRRFLFAMGFVLVYGIVLNGLYSPNKEQVNGGLLALAELFVDRYNWVFCKNYVVSGTLTVYLSLGLFVATLMSFFIFYLLSGLGKKKGVFALLPILLVTLIMYLGITPGRNEILMMALGIFMLYRARRKEEMVFPLEWVYAGMVLGGFFLTGILFAAPLQYMFSFHDQAKEIELSIERNVSQAMAVRHAFESQRIGNNSPRYQNAKILKITADSLPEGNLYLKDFYSYNYEDGVWMDPEEGFEEQCMEAGVNAMYASTLNLQNLDPVVNYENEYYGVMQKELFASYGSEFSRDSGSYPDFYGDCLIKKSRNERTSFFKGYRTNEFDPSNLFLEEEAEETSVDPGVRAFNEWYHSYVQKQFQPVKGYFADLYEGREGDYLNVLYDESIADELDIDRMEQLYEEATSLIRDEDMKGMKNIIVNLVPGLAEGEVVIDHNKTYVEVDIPLVFKNESIAIDNSYKYKVVQCITNYLRTKYNYSWELDEIDKSQDPVEYFLKVGKEGYCVHFASAGVLLLREFGVPARYASGFFVSPSMFEKQADGSYVAEVLDRNAHAWAEIYVDQVGWIPLEMTPGYSVLVQGEADAEDMQADEAASPDLVVYKPSEKDKPKETMESSEETKEQEESEESDETKDLEETEDSKEEMSKEDSAKQDSDKKDAASGQKAGKGAGGSVGTDASTDSGISTFLLDAFLCALGIGLLILLGYLFYLVRTREIKYALKKKSYKNVVRALNHKIFRKVHGLGKKANDKEFEEDLRRKLIDEGKKAFHKTQNEENNNSTDPVELFLDLFESKDEPKYHEEYKKIVIQAEKEAKEYMRIVKAATFSKGKLTKEEYRVVKDMYKKICKKGIK